MSTTAKKNIRENRNVKSTNWQVGLTWADNLIRRMMDIVIAFFGMLLLLPFILVVILLINHDSPGPIFYKGRRAGKNGKEFNILKFRTMYENIESYNGAKVTAGDDPRITPTGKFLRETKLNELPQLWNVFVGEMSIVGPRPEDPEIAKAWPEEYFKEILSVKPGITSPASVLYRNEETMLQSRNLMDRYLIDILPSKLRLDQLYIRHRNILSDLDVIFWTAIALLPRMKNFQVPEHLLYQGPMNVFINRYFSWFVMDFFVSLTAVTAAGVIRRLSSPLDLGFEKSAAFGLTIALLFSLLNSVMGINRINWSRASAGEAMDIGISTTIVTLILFLVSFIVPDDNFLPPIVLVTSGMFSFAGFIIIRYRGRLISGFASRWLGLRHVRIDLLGEPVLVVGSGETAHFANWLLRNGPLSQAFNVVGMVDDDPKKIGSRIDGLNVIARTDEIPAIIEKYDIGLVLFAITEIDPKESERILKMCNTPSTRVIMVPDIMDSLRAHFPKSDAERDELEEKIVQHSTQDRLTGVMNRKTFIRSLEYELPRSLRYGHFCSLVLFSIEYSWPDGAARLDAITAQVLQGVADRAIKNIREIDLLARYDENSFIILLPETNLESANKVAERIHKNLTFTPVWTDRGPLSLCVSLGVVSQNEDLKDASSMLASAEKAMKLASLVD